VGLYEQLLLFPERAEYIKQSQYDCYRVRLDHWKDLSKVFLSTFKAVHDRQGASVLLVHGPQGTGKTLFSLELEKGFLRSKQGQLERCDDNLWHTLVADAGAPDVIRRATEHTALRRVAPESGWLEKERGVARADQQPVRIIVIDDAHRDVFIREWAGLEQADYLRLKADKKEEVALSAVAQQLVQDCRNDFQRCIFLLLSSQAPMMNRLKEHIDESHRDLATVIGLPLPEASLKEEIVRTNLNRLNNVSYWYCLDHAGPSEKRAAYQVLTGSGGFTDSFKAIDRARGSDAQAKQVKRAGRPANKNLITLVTLGSEPLIARAFIEEQELPAETHYRGNHLASWLLRDTWASSLDTSNDATLTRRARLVESEFSLRWVTLDLRATWALLAIPPVPRDLGERLLEIIKFFPRIAKPEELKQQVGESEQLDQEISESALDPLIIEGLDREFRQLGQRRSGRYEPALRARLADYGCGLAVFQGLRPDFIVEDYSPCAVTLSASDSSKAIEDAIRRTCHVLEFTTFLQSDMHGLAPYLLDKVERYARLLESV
jgi:hypothetical protein